MGKYLSTKITGHSILNSSSAVMLSYLNFISGHLEANAVRIAQTVMSKVQN